MRQLQVSRQFRNFADKERVKKYCFARLIYIRLKSIFAPTVPRNKQLGQDPGSWTFVGLAADWMRHFHPTKRDPPGAPQPVVARAL